MHRQIFHDPSGMEESGVPYGCSIGWDDARENPALSLSIGYRVPGEIAYIRYHRLSMLDVPAGSGTVPPPGDTAALTGRDAISRLLARRDHDPGEIHV